MALAAVVHRPRPRHEFDDVIDRMARMMRVGHRDIERIAHEIDRRQRHAEIDRWMTFDIGDRIMGLEQHGPIGARNEVGLRERARRGDLGQRGLPRRLAEPPREGAISDSRPVQACSMLMFCAPGSPRNSRMRLCRKTRTQVLPDLG